LIEGTNINADELIDYSGIALMTLEEAASESECSEAGCDLTTDDFGLLLF